MSFFRSETMAYYQLVVPREFAWEVFNEFGKLGMIQLIDRNPDDPIISRPFYPMIKRADDVIAKLSFLETEMLKFKIKNLKCTNYKQFLERMSVYSKEINQNEDKWFDLIEQTLEEKYSQLMEQLQILDQLTIKKNTLFEHKAVLTKSKDVLGTTYYSRGRNIAINPQVGSEDIKNQQQNAYNLNYMVGVVDREDAIRFKRMVFRASKGNAWIVQSDIEYSRVDQSLVEQANQEDKQDKSTVQNHRTVFIIVYQAGTQDYLMTKLNKICDSFNCSKFGLPSDPSLIQQKTLDIDSQLDESENVIKLTNQKIKELLLDYAQIQPQLKVSLLEMSKLLMIKEKTVYSNLNCLTLKHTIYAGLFWAPKSVEGELHHTLHQLSQLKQNVSVGQIIELEQPHKATPPTYFKINDFNCLFQEIVNTYGTPRYKEVNPGMFAVMFFPFMFGIMFGDVGHGGLLLTAAILLVKYNDQLKKIPDMVGLLQARYLFLMMGLCAFYAGIIYNDFMSLSLNFFGSCFENVEDSEETTYIEGCVYPIGFDPKWYVASNELNFFNSFKMKFAIIFGVSQMMFGILLKGANNLYFKNYIDFFCEFIPQIIFLTITFGYMSLLILLKWAQNWQGRTEQAPSIINMMINIPLMAGSTDNQPLYDQETQETIQYYILIVAFICVPWMLVPKPILEVILHAKHKGQKHGDPHALEPKNESMEALLPLNRGYSKDVAEEVRLQFQRELQEKELKKKKVQQKKEVEMTVQQQKEAADDSLLPVPANDKPLPPQPKQHEEEEFDVGEIFVHQIIETIEFVLGSISNTASYLRLWALSLAHGQLAKVFFEKSLGAGIVEGNFLILVVGWPVFLHCTVGVLMSMDLMECFLHALRLQWVEFQNKFFKADGIKFVPLSFHDSIVNSQKDQ